MDDQQRSIDRLEAEKLRLAMENADLRAEVVAETERAEAMHRRAQVAEGAQAKAEEKVRMLLEGREQPSPNIMWVYRRYMDELLRREAAESALTAAQAEIADLRAENERLTLRRNEAWEGQCKAQTSLNFAQSRILTLIQDRNEARKALTRVKDAWLAYEAANTTETHLAALDRLRVELGLPPLAPWRSKDTGPELIEGGA